MTGSFPALHPDTGLPTSVTVYEVGPRDGLQAEAAFVPTDLKISFIRDLLAAGLSPVEASELRVAEVGPPAGRCR
ncbi:hypothetical protein [Aeromicrobium sp. UC242_57]|uniref:hypothetical protein n=1 Tax=Aeromicrobium sp. UC242_57 TaxID=3374624 RepID=UPI00379E8FE6